MFDKAFKRPVPGDYDRTWLSDEYFDLIVWHTSTGAVHGFQLCYDKPLWNARSRGYRRRAFHICRWTTVSGTYGTIRPLFWCRTVLSQRMRSSQIFGVVELSYRVSCATSCCIKSTSTSGHERSNKTMQPTTGRRMVSLYFMKRRALQITLALASSG